MGSVSRLEPSEVKSSLGHISKTKLLNNLDLQFSYSRQRNARACYKISIWIVNKLMFKVRVTFFFEVKFIRWHSHWSAADKCVDFYWCRCLRRTENLHFQI